MTQGVAGNLGDGYLWTTDPATGAIEGRATQTLYGTRTWAGTHTSPLLFEVSQVLFRLSRWENLEYAKKI